MRKQLCSLTLALVMTLALFTLPAPALDGIGGGYSEYAEG
jgi:hypothetical protein